MYGEYEAKLLSPEVRMMSQAITPAVKTPLVSTVTPMDITQEVTPKFAEQPSAQPLKKRLRMVCT